jgi:DNA-binding HxlR family transcriptional regulator
MSPRTAGALPVLIRLASPSSARGAPWRALRVPGRVLAERPAALSRGVLDVEEPEMPSKRATTYHCPVQLTLDVVGGKWKPLILWLLRGGKKRFNDLLASMPGVTHKVLIQHLRELERDGIVERRVIGEPRVRVDYGLTELGMTLKPSLDALASWAKRHHRRFGATILLYEGGRRPAPESADCPPVAPRSARGA